MNVKIDITAESVSASCGQWNRGRRSLWVGDVPVELSLRPEGDHWDGQHIKVMLGSEWQQIAPPVLDGTVPWVGTYAPREKDGLKREQIVAALNVMQEYAVDWIARKRG